MESKIVAFCGSKRSGKSTASDVLKRHYQVKEIALAGHLKKVCANVFDISIENFLEPALKEKELNKYVVLGTKDIEDTLLGFGIPTCDFDLIIRPHISYVLTSPRKVLQYIGTEVLRPIDPLIHLKFALKALNPKYTYSISDLRFENEFNYLKSNVSYFYPFYIKRHYAETRAQTDIHSSETDFLKFKHKCIQIDNNRSLEQFEKDCIDIFNII